MGNCLSVCLTTKLNKNYKKDKKRRVAGNGVKVTCCCNKNSDVREIYDEISITDVEI
jgi:hypothetical protein|uniref:Uncharacterized protein n=1 Tax=viral metagenome TaxID=1070528 RepID=A0A6C0C153_9ZZZZ